MRQFQIDHLRYCAENTNGSSFATVRKSHLSAALAMIDTHRVLIAALEEIATHGDDDHPCEHESVTWCRRHIESLAKSAISKAKGES